MNQDEKSALGGAADKLNLSTGELDERLKGLRPPEARSWTKEHRVIAAAAWLATPR